MKSQELTELIVLTKRNGCIHYIGYRLLLVSKSGGVGWLCPLLIQLRILLGKSKKNCINVNKTAKEKLSVHFWLKKNQS